MTCIFKCISVRYQILHFGHYEMTWQVPSKGLNLSTMRSSQINLTHVLKIRSINDCIEE